MKDEEIIRKLKEADNLLQAYRDIVQPVAEELAKRKSIVVHGKEGGYSGDLGCWEGGLNTICLHLKDEFRGESFSADTEKCKKGYEFEHEWGKKLDEARIRLLYISGHF